MLSGRAYWTVAKGDGFGAGRFTRSKRLGRGIVIVGMRVIKVSGRNSLIVSARCGYMVMVFEDWWWDWMEFAEIGNFGNRIFDMGNGG